jgi:hypothetical protein
MTRIDIQRERKGKMLEVLHLFRCFTHTDTPSFFVTHHLTHTTLPHTTLSFLLSLPRYNIWCFLLEEVALWGYPVLSLVVAVVASAIFSAQRNSTLFLSLSCTRSLSANLVQTVGTQQTLHVYNRRNCKVQIFRQFLSTERCV